MNIFIIMALWFLFTLIMLDLIHKELFSRSEAVVKKTDELDKIKEIKYKTISEQLKFINNSNKLYISFPLLLVMITIGALIYAIMTIYIQNFIAGLVVALLWSVIYSMIMVTFKQTLNDYYYIMLLSMYILFITVSIDMNTYYISTINFWVMLAVYIGIFITWMKVKKWFL